MTFKIATMKINKLIIHDSVLQNLFTHYIYIYIYI